MDTYDVEECRSIYDAILKQAPDVKVVFVPDDLIEEIVHVQKNSPLYYDLATISTATGYPSNIPQPYLTNISSDSTTATIRLDNEGETKLW
jgi:hypothetical protein